MAPPGLLLLLILFFFSVEVKLFSLFFLLPSPHSPTEENWRRKGGVWFSASSAKGRGGVGEGLCSKWQLQQWIMCRLSERGGREKKKFASQSWSEERKLRRAVQIITCCKPINDIYEALPLRNSILLNTNKKIFSDSTSSGTISAPIQYRPLLTPPHPRLFYSCTLEKCWSYLSYFFPNQQRWNAEWKLSRNTYSLHTCFCTFGADSYAQSVLINKISASELSRNFIKSALLVGSLFFSKGGSGQSCSKHLQKKKKPNRLWYVAFRLAASESKTGGREFVTGATGIQRFECSRQLSKKKKKKSGCTIPQLQDVHHKNWKTTVLPWRA